MPLVEAQAAARKKLGRELFTENVFFQKLEYLHQNPVVAGLVFLPEYYYSSAKFYDSGLKYFKMLTHYSGN